MSLRIYIYIYVYIYIYIYVYIQLLDTSNRLHYRCAYVHMHAYMCTHVDLSVCLQVCNAHICFINVSRGPMRTLRAMHKGTTT
jgi:hypothetical protein